MDLELADKVAVVTGANNGIGKLEYWYAPEQLEEKVWAEAADGFHQVGTTRMGDDPAQNVVDRDLKVHGVENLYIASSSVFTRKSEGSSRIHCAQWMVPTSDRKPVLNTRAATDRATT